jgi:hypothetical protein
MICNAGPHKSVQDNPGGGGYLFRSLCCFHIHEFIYGEGANSLNALPIF